MFAEISKKVLKVFPFSTPIPYRERTRAWSPSQLNLSTGAVVLEPISKITIHTLEPIKLKRSSPVTLFCKICNKKRSDLHTYQNLKGYHKKEV